MANEKHLNNILHGDCLELMTELEDQSVDMILCDLPYGVTARNRWDVVIPFPKLWGEYERIIKDNGAIVLTAIQPFAAQLIMSNPKLFRYEWIWEKTSPTGHLNAKKMPMRAHESVLVFYKKLPTYNPQKTKGHARKASSAAHKRNSKMSTNYRSYGLTSYDSTERYPRSVQVFPTDKQKEALHPTQKPIALLEYLIRTYTNEGDVVLDNCIGSGSTAVAACNTNRNFIGMELDKGYYEIATLRVQECSKRTIC